MMDSQLQMSPGQAVSGIRHCVWGVMALVVGIFVFGIPCGLLAIRLGSVGATHGAPTFGTVVKLGGWTEIILTAIGLVAMISSVR
jgi:hypothetical protein